VTKKLWITLLSFFGSHGEIAKKRTRNLLKPLIELLAEFRLLFMVLDWWLLCL
jgi:hypothetical protein